MIKISSSDRHNGTSHNFDVVLPQTLDSLDGKYEIPMISIPTSWYNIRAKDNNILPVRTGGEMYLVEIKEGTYDAKTLMDTVTTSLNTATGLVWTITYDEKTMKYTFSNTSQDFTFLFQSKKEYSIGKALGFGISDYISSASFQLTSSGMISINTIDCVSIVITNTNSVCSSTSSQPFQAFVPINTALNNFNVWEFLHPITLNFPRQTRQFHVSVQTHDGKLLNLNDVDWWFFIRKA